MTEDKVVNWKGLKRSVGLPWREFSRVLRFWYHELL
jgi:hypothetical protein